MYSRGYKLLVSVPPLAWAAIFLLAPYLFLFCFSFWSVQAQTIVHQWTLNNYRQLVQKSGVCTGAAAVRADRGHGYVSLAGVEFSAGVFRIVPFRAHAKNCFINW